MRERLVEIRDQQGRLFEPDRETQQIRRRCRMWTFDRSAVLDQAMRTAQAGGAGKQADPGRYCHGLLAAAAHLGGEHAAESGHLPRRHLVTGMAGQTRIVDRFDRPVRLEKPGHSPIRESP